MKTTSLRGAVLLTLICSAAFAEPQAQITVDPNNFAAGQNISNATIGARLRALYVVPNPQSPGFNMPLENTGVYAQAEQPGCKVFFNLPCAPIGNNVLGYTPVSTPLAYPTFWGEANRAFECVQGDCGEPDDLQTNPTLRIYFDTPTNQVSLLSTWFDGEGGIIYAFAFDAAGQLLDYCDGFPGQDTGIPGCTAALYSGVPLFAWVRYTMSHPTADISSVIVGGAANIRPIAQVQFNSPVSLQLDGLIKEVAVVAPREGLAIKLLIARVHYGVHDFRAACAILNGVDHEVTAQNGKRINMLVASRLLSTTRAIETALSCQ
jgi:hypothetical protein